MIITATNSFITRPIADAFGIEHLIATEPECRDGRFTGRVAGIPSYREGKVQRLETWLAEHSASVDGSTFYSDSHNDIPLLERVDHPVAVNPDDQLEQVARDRGWDVLELG
jgi:HAD superfamily hydrolase (TIGR01490 family)